MNRRNFLSSSAHFASLATLGGMNAFAAKNALAQVSKQRALKPLILIELKGGNDGLNTLIPFGDPLYYSLRPNLAISENAVFKLTSQLGLHPALSELAQLWQTQSLAIIQGVGYTQPNLSHFRSIDIWDTASNSQDTLQTGWLSRALPLLDANPYAADVVLVGSNDLGPAQGGARAVTITNPQGFAAQAKLAHQVHRPLPGALAHIAKVENDIVGASVDIKPIEFETQFTGQWAQVLRAASSILASSAAPVVRLTLGGFDTHRGQLAAHERLLEQLSKGVLTLKQALTERGLWDNTVLMTYSEFGRRPAENASQGTDHGTANVHFVAGGRVRGGLYGKTPLLNDLNQGNLRHGIEFRQLYASVLEQHWGLTSAQVKQVLGGDFKAIPFIKT